MKFFRRFWIAVTGYFIRPRWLAEVCEDIPEKPRRGRVYLIGDEDAPWAAGLVCPCGCGALIQLSLVTEDRPSWRAHTSEFGQVTLHPSIWRVRGCKSHFWIRDGRLIWAAPAPGDPA